MEQNDLQNSDSFQYTNTWGGHSSRFDAFFPLLDRVTEHSPTTITSYRSRCLTEWDIIAMEIEAMTLIHRHSCTFTHSLRNETVFLQSGRTVWMYKKLPLKREDIRTDWAVTWEGNSPQLFHTSLEMDGYLSFFFILSNVDLSFG